MAEAASAKFLFEFEEFVNTQNIISFSFKQLSSGKVTPTNYSRLSMISFHVIMITRFTISVILDNSDFDNAIGEVISSLGTVGNFLKIFAILLSTLTVLYLIAISYCERNGQLTLWYELIPGKETFETEYGLTLSKLAPFLHLARIVCVNLVPCILGSIFLICCSWHLFVVDHSIWQLLYNLLWTPILVYMYIYMYR